MNKDKSSDKSAKVSSPSKSPKKKDWITLKEDLEIKESRISKGWVRQGESFMDPSTGKETTLTEEHVNHAIRFCEGNLIKYTRPHQRMRLATNIVLLFVFLGSAGFLLYHFHAFSGITGFVVANAPTISFSQPDSTPSPTPQVLPSEKGEIGGSIFFKQPSQQKNIRTDNHPPKFEGLESVTVDGSIIIDLSEYAKDEDHDALAYLATQPEGTRVEIRDNKMRITALKEGKSTITLYASDDIGLAEQQIPITFKPK
jgi:hypothetical protein